MASRRLIVIAQHKPFSFLSPSTRPLGNKKFALDLLTSRNRSHNSLPYAAGEPRHLPGLTCAGRLDADSTGLMLWSNDYTLVQRIIGSDTTIEKECAPLLLPPLARCLSLHISFFSTCSSDLVRVSGQELWTETQRHGSARWLSQGIVIDGVPLKPAGVEWLNEAQLRITLREGKHRQVRAPRASSLRAFPPRADSLIAHCVAQIRRMCELLGLQVTALKRVRIGPVKLEALKVGYWKQLPGRLVDLLQGVESKRPAGRVGPDGWGGSRSRSRSKRGRSADAAPSGGEPELVRLGGHESRGTARTS